jgi:hypothetical protein
VCGKQKVLGEYETSKNRDPILDHSHKCGELLNRLGHAGARAKAEPGELLLFERRGTIANPGAAESSFWFG